MVRENAAGQGLQSLAGGIAEMDEGSKEKWLKELVPRAENGKSQPDISYVLKATQEGIGSEATTDEARKKFRNWTQSGSIQNGFPKNSIRKS